MLGVVPCAGRSTRMGRSKALLDADGASFLVRVVSALREGGCHPVVVVVRDAHGAEAALARELDAEVVLNPDPSPGPISSLRAALGAVPGTEWMVVLPVDHPGVEAATVATLLAAAREGTAEIVLPRLGEERGHPALFRASVFPELLDPTLEGGARTVVRRDPGRVREVEVADPGVLQDIDEPEEYREAYGGEGAAPPDTAVDRGTSGGEGSVPPLPGGGGIRATRREDPSA